MEKKSNLNSGKTEKNVITRTFFDIKIVQEWLGHSFIATTGNIYGHLQFKQKIATGELLENLLSG